MADVRIANAEYHDVEDVELTSLTGESVLFSIRKNQILVLTEDMVTVVKDSSAKGVAPYSTSYYYTNITVNDLTEDDLTEGLLIMPLVVSKMVVASSYRNVRIRFGASGSWHPVMTSTAILGGSSYFTATNYRLYQYRTNTRSEGAFHLMTDSNSTYSLMTDAEIAAGTATTGRTISAALWKTKQDAIADLDSIRSGAAAGASALQSLPEHSHTDEEIAMTDFDGNLQQAFAFAGLQMEALFGAVSEMVPDAPSDGKQYARKNGSWSEFNDFTNDYKQKVDDLYSDYSAALGVI